MGSWPKEGVDYFNKTSDYPISYRRIAINFILDYRLNRCIKSSFAV